jgi:hypothetical protein
LRISHVRVDLAAEDINSLIADFAADANIHITHITPDGIHGQVKFLFWNIDFVARPSSDAENEVSVNVSAYKLVAIPDVIVNRQLREVVRDAPPGIDVIRNSLVMHVPSLLRTFGIGLKVKELQCHDGFVRLDVEDVEMPELAKLMGARMQ